MNEKKQRPKEAKEKKEILVFSVFLGIIATIIGLGGLKAGQQIQGAIFLIIAALSFSSFIWAGKGYLSLTYLLSKNKNQPWLNNRHWRNYTVVSNDYPNLAKAFAGTLMLALFAGMFVFGLIKRLPIFPMVLLGIFALLFVYNIFYTLYLTLKLVIYDTSVLRISALPLTQGNSYIVNLHCKKLEAIGPMEITLRCTSTKTEWVAVKYSQGIGEPSTITDILFEEKNTRDLAEIKHSLLLGELTFEIKIPTGYPERNDKGEPYINYMLELIIPTKGINYRTEFDLPVYNLK